MRPVRVSNYILICAHSKIRIAEARVGFKAANRESFPYIMHIVDEPRKFSPSNVLTYTVYTGRAFSIGGSTRIQYVTIVRSYIINYCRFELDINTCKYTISYLLLYTHLHSHMLHIPLVSMAGKFVALITTKQIAD